jgi:hypothetical protein
MYHWYLQGQSFFPEGLEAKFLTAISLVCPAFHKEWTYNSSLSVAHGALFWNVQELLRYNKDLSKFPGQNFPHHG